MSEVLKTDGLIKCDQINNELLVPSTRDEPNLILKLSGRNEIEYVEICGWTRSNHIRFPGLRTDLKMQNSELPSGISWEKYVDNLDTNRETIDNLSKRGDPKNYNWINAPLLVQVVAKKKPEVLMLENKNNVMKEIGSKRIFVFGNILVADSSGLCCVTTWNEANEVFHDKVEVGDVILINRARYKRCSNESLKFQFPFKKIVVNLELKIDKYDIRNIKHFPYMPNKYQKLPPFLFPQDEIIIYVPTYFVEKEGIHTSSRSLQNELSKVVANDYTSYFDIIGMITYVGAFHRFESFQGHATCLFNPIYGTNLKGFETITGELKQDYITQYVAYRWIHIIDKTSKPLLVKIYIHNGSKSLQTKIVPGSLIMLTHCQLMDGHGFQDYVQGSLFSNIYVNGELRKYFKIMPRSFVEKVKDSILSYKSCKEMIQRKDVEWSVGGVHPNPIINQRKFTNYIKTIKDPIIFKYIPFDKTFNRREGFSILFRGNIENILKVKMENNKSHQEQNEITHNPLMTSSEIKRVWNCYDECRCNHCEMLHWFHKRRKLPLFDGDDLELIHSSKTSVQLLDKISVILQPQCNVLLFPSKYPTNYGKIIHPFKELPSLDSVPHYHLVLIDEINNCMYKVNWKGELLMDMTGNNKRMIIGVIDIYCCETDQEIGMDLVLRDFLFEEDFIQTTNDSEGNDSDREFPYDEIFTMISD